MEKSIFSGTISDLSKGAAPATRHLFKIDKEAIGLKDDNAGLFHHIVANCFMFHNECTMISNSQLLPYALESVKAPKKTGVS
jgi:hypothetical protein